LKDLQSFIQSRGIFRIHQGTEFFLFRQASLHRNGHKYKAKEDDKMLNEIIRSIFQGYRESEVVRSRKHEQQYEELKEYPMLFSSSYLHELCYKAETVEECEEILSYINRYGTYTSGIESYEEVFGKARRKAKRIKEESEW
jgi:hypothetical protein